MKLMKQDRKSRYTRMVLKDTLIEIMKEKPLSKITIKELCEKADLNRSTFYAHYSNPYELLQDIEEETLSWLKEALISIANKNEKEEMIPLLEDLFQYLARNSNHLQVLLSEQGSPGFQKQLFTLVYQECNFSASVSQKLNLPENEDYFIFIVNGSVGLIQHWLKNGLKKSPKEMSEIIYKMTSVIL